MTLPAGANGSSYNLIPYSVCYLHPPKSEHFWPRLRVAPLQLKTAAAVGTKIVALLFIPATNFSYSQLQRLIPTPAASGAFPFRYVRHLRLPFRPVRTGICTPSSIRSRAAIRHHPPTQKRTDERTDIRLWHVDLPPNGNFLLNASALMTMARISSPPGKRILPSLRTSLRQSLASQSLPSPSIVVHGHATPVAVNNDHCGRRGDRLRPPACQRFSPTPLILHGVGRVDLHLLLQTIFDGCTSSAVNSPPPFAFPAHQCRAASLPPMVGAS